MRIMQNIPAMIILRILNQTFGELGASIERISKGERFLKEKPLLTIPTTGKKVDLLA